MLTKKHLKNSFHDGEFILERARLFWPECDKNYYLHGVSKTMGSDLICQPIAMGEKNKSLLVCLTDTKNQNWYSWIHAD